jgi:predicted peroxiredoxin
MNDLQKLIDKVIDKAVIGCDTYKHNGSTWLLFTDDKKWVIELTKEGTLWYNYYFFQKLFKVIALDVVENQHYITKWVEDTVINGVKSIKGEYYKEIQKVEYTIQNGVKSTSWDPTGKKSLVEDTIQNGVKETHSGCDLLINDSIEDAIQNGVKKTIFVATDNSKSVEDTIQNGVKYTSWHDFCDTSKIEDTIQNGVKKTYSDKIPHEYDWSKQFTEEIDDIIQNGVKHTEKSLQIDGSCVIEDVIKEGVKHTEYGDWLDGDERFDDIIENGVKETTPGGYLGSVEMKGKMVHQFEHAKQDNNVEDVIKSGIKATTTNLPLSQDDGQIAEIEDVIKNGIKKTEAAALFDEELKMDTVISNGIKETIPVVPGDILDTIDFMSYNNTTNVQHLISDVIKNGIKETHDDVMPHTGRVEGVIKNGVKECIPSRTPLYNPMDFSVQYRENHRLDDVASVLEKGIKEVQPLPAQDGNMDYSNYYYRQGESGKPHTQYVDDVITNGIKKTEAAAFRIVDGVISNGKIIK